MISAIVQSALQMGYLSVEAEGLIRQILALESYRETELESLELLYTALKYGKIRREVTVAFNDPHRDQHRRWATKTQELIPDNDW